MIRANHVLAVFACAGTVAFCLGHQKIGAGFMAIVALITFTDLLRGRTQRKRL
jgi:hypothetical protein